MRINIVLQLLYDELLELTESGIHFRRYPFNDLPFELTKNIVRT